MEPEVLPWAERVGGPETFAVMGRALDVAINEQHSAQSANPPDFARISQLDRVRSSLKINGLFSSRSSTSTVCPNRNGPSRSHSYICAG